MQRKLTFKEHKHCSEATQPENEINQLEKINLMKIVLKKIIKHLKKKKKKRTKATDIKITTKI